MALARLDLSGSSADFTVIRTSIVPEDAVIKVRIGGAEPHPYLWSTIGHMLVQSCLFCLISFFGVPAAVTQDTRSH
jgi:hypothetical protein